MASTVSVLIEEGRTKSFASALDWPGWARAARDAERALEALESYRDRYAGVLAASSITSPAGRLVVAARVRGDATTDFGAPSQRCELDDRALRTTTRAALAAIMAACWDRFDEVAASAGSLRAGARGGGRSVEKMVAHVGAAEVAYARKLGLKASASNGDRRTVEALRARITGVITASEAPDREGAWPPRYAARRIAWHVCDHLFEIEDRSTSG
jgi:hypothetical protein